MGGRGREKEEEEEEGNKERKKKKKKAVICVLLKVEPHGLPFLSPCQIPVPVLLPLTSILHFKAQLRNYSCTQ